MDQLSRSFAQETALRQIDDCTNIEELKSLTKMLMKTYFESRSFIAQLMMPDLPNIQNVKLPRPAHQPLG